MSIRIWGATARTGGTEGCLDNIDGVKLSDEDRCFVFETDAVYCYYLDADSGLTESDPDRITPDSNADDKVWILLWQSIDSTMDSLILNDLTVSQAVFTDASKTLVSKSESEFKTAYNLEIGTDVLAEQTIGIADNNLLEVDGTPADNDFAKFTAAGIEGRSYTEVKQDLNLEIGTDVLAEQTIGIANDNLVEMDDADAADNDYAKFTTAGLEGRSYTEVKQDLNLEIGTDVLAEQTIGIADDNLVEMDDADAADNDYCKLTANGIEGREYSEVRTDLGLVIGTNVLAEQTIGIANDNLLEVDGTPVNGEAAVFTAAGINSLSEAEFKSAFNMEAGTDFLAQQTIGIADNNLVEIDSATVADNEYARFTANGLESLSIAEMQAALGIAGGFPAGTDMWFYQAAAPADWTITAAAADRVLAVAGGAQAYNVAGGNTAGTWTQPSHSLSIAELASHTHSVTGTAASTGAHTHTLHVYPSGANPPGPIPSTGNKTNSGAITGSDGAHSHTVSGTAAATGSGTAHSHGTTYRPLAQVGIICSKDA